MMFDFIDQKYMYNRVGNSGITCNCILFGLPDFNYLLGIIVLLLLTIHFNLFFSWYVCSVCGFKAKLIPQFWKDYIPAWLMFNLLKIPCNIINLSMYYWRFILTAWCSTVSHQLLVLSNWFWFRWLILDFEKQRLIKVHILSIKGFRLKVL